MTGRKDGKAKPYPLEKCVVSDEKLGEMGKPVTMTWRHLDLLSGALAVTVET
jgi:hypothetical protein